MDGREPAIPFPFTAPGHLEFPAQYAEERAKCPVSRVRLPHGQQAWLATGHAQVRKVLVDPRFSRALAAEQENRKLTPATVVNTSLIGLDPPDHTRLRSLAAHAFTARRVESLRPRVIEIAQSLLDAMERETMAGEQGPVDLVTRFMQPLPALVISEMLGVPERYLEQFVEWSTQALSGSSAPETAAAGYRSLIAFIGELIAMKRETPADDVVSALIEARDERDRLTDEEMLALCVLLLVAGHEATTTVLGWSIVILTTRRPEQWRRLGEHPEEVPATVEELLRVVRRTDIGSGFPRVVKEDVELGGVLIRAGEVVIPAMDAANRDPAVFDDPDTIDFTRADNPHLGFGAGIHFCPGAPMARLQLQEGLRLLAERFPGLRVTVPVDELEITPNTIMRILRALPVTW
jgi:cytochrome P450